MQESTDEKQTCPRCRSLGHPMASCPQAYCGNCNMMGHTRRVCQVNHTSNARDPPGPCPNCKKLGHWKRDCPEFRSVNSGRQSEQSERDLRSNMIALRN